MVNTLVNDGHDLVDDRRNDQEKSGPFHSAQFAGAQDDEFLPGVRHLQSGGDAEEASQGYGPGYYYAPGDYGAPYPYRRSYYYPY